MRGGLLIEGDANADELFEGAGEADGGGGAVVSEQIEKI